MKTVTILKKARGLIEKGWVQGAGYGLDENGNRCYCAVTALTNAHNPNGWSYAPTPGMHTLRILVPESPFGHLTPVAAFNDNPKTKKEDVLALYDWAIGIELAGGL